jgi:ABC-type lipoprotein release transport system permease subunit
VILLTALAAAAAPAWRASRINPAEAFRHEG